MDAIIEHLAAEWNTNACCVCGGHSLGGNSGLVVDGLAVYGKGRSNRALQGAA
jgi:hypothetical protein